jgi:hypothetical protein
MERHRRAASGLLQISLVVAAVLAIATLIFILIVHKRVISSKDSSETAVSSYCVGKAFTPGSSGRCVSDIQTIINYMEHSGLTECPFVGGTALTINGTYDTATTLQVKAVQTWANCYAKQEGFTSHVPQTGIVGKATWGELCTYGYTDPVHSSAAEAGTTITAGKDAGCAHL